MEKRYVVRKYIIAKSAKDAIKKDKNADADVDDVWLDQDYKGDNVIGFTDK